MIKLEPTLLDFLTCPTPAAWLAIAPTHLNTLIIDHANCEKKAASTALSLMHRHPDKTSLLIKLSQLAREELLHFEQVVALMQKRSIPYNILSASRYATSLHKHCRTTYPEKLIDALIIGAFIEARSCERFHSLIPHVDEELGSYYQYLLKSESRHFQDYLALAKQYSKSDIQPRIDLFRTVENELINSTDTEFRFHSGIPENNPK